MKIKDLSKPLDVSMVQWRLGTKPKQDGGKAMALCYIDSRAVMNMLDEVCGPENWSDTYQFNGSRIICTLSIRIGDEWVSKSDGAGDTAVEAEKGGLSDAFKRAAVKWGIGRYLYDIAAAWVDTEGPMKHPKIARSEYARLRKILPAGIDGAVEPSSEPPTQEQEDAYKAQEDMVKQELEKAKDMDDLSLIWKAHSSDIAKLKAESAPHYSRVVKFKDYMKDDFSKGGGK